MLDVVPMADCPHESFRTAHVPYSGVGKDLGNTGNGVAAPCGCYDGSDLCGLSGADDFVDPEHVVPDEVSGFLNGSLVGKREGFL